MRSVAMLAQGSSMTPQCATSRLRANLFYVSPFLVASCPAQPPSLGQLPCSRPVLVTNSPFSKPFLVTKCPCSKPFLVTNCPREEFCRGEFSRGEFCRGEFCRRESPLGWGSTPWGPKIPPRPGQYPHDSPFPVENLTYDSPFAVESSPVGNFAVENRAVKNSVATLPGPRRERVLFWKV